MEGLLIFDQQNDLIYSKLNGEMKLKIFELARQQELVETNAVKATQVHRKTSQIFIVLI